MIYRLLDNCNAVYLVADVSLKTVTLTLLVTYSYDIWHTASITGIIIRVINVKGSFGIGDHMICLFELILNFEQQ